MSSDAALCETQRAKDVEQRFLKYLQKSMSHSQVVDQIVQGKYYMEDSEAPMFCNCFSIRLRITLAEPIRCHHPFHKWDRVFGNGASLMHMQLEVTSQGHSHYTLLLPEGSPENGGGYVLPVPQLSNHPPDGMLKAQIEDATHKGEAQIEDATHKGDAQDVNVPTSAVLEAQIAEATCKGDAQEVDVPSSAVLQAQIAEATHKGDAQEVDVDLPTSAVLEVQIAEATHKGDTQEVDVPSSAVLETYAHDLHLPMTSYLMSQRCEVSCGVYPFGDPHGMTNYLMSQQHEVSCGGYRFPDPHGITSYPISTPFLNYLMIKGPDIPIRLSSSAVLQAYLKVQSSA